MLGFGEVAEGIDRVGDPGDKLANDPEVNVVATIKWFLEMALARPRD